MFFLNLGLGEFLGLFSAISAGVVALYLLDRSRRKQRVATLRFWKPAEMPSQVQQRRRIQQPWSLLLQLLSIALLLLAIAQVRIGTQSTVTRDHVLILDSSAWMGARHANGGTLIEDARAQARAWLKTIPSTDRVMLVRAASLASPATRFELNREVLDRAIQETQPGATAFDLNEAIRFAAQLQKLNSADPGGEIVIATAGRISDKELPSKFPANLRILPISGPAANCGIRKMGLLRSPTDPESWEIFITAKNYGPAPQPVTLALQFGGAPMGSRQFVLAPGQEQESTFSFKTRANGIVEARLLASRPDAFPQDDRASFEVPAQQQLRVTVYSSEPNPLKPLLNSNPNVTATYLPPSAYSATAKSDLVILDRFAPAAPPAVDSIWIDPPVAHSPVPVAGVHTKAKITTWTSDPVLGAGLHTRDLELETVTAFRRSADDIAIAEIDGGAVIVARKGRPRMIVMGVDPERSKMKFELATPLLFANSLRWLEPDSFRRWELTGGYTGLVKLKLDGKADPANLRVLSGDGANMPYTMDGDSVRFFANSPGTVRVLTGDREHVFSLTVPEVGDTFWQIPDGVKRGVPRRTPIEAFSRDVWYWLALLGGLGLLADWYIYGRHRVRLRSGTSTAADARPLERKAS